jgi:hypothetical protein
MKKNERTSIVRILIDLIMADSVIDSGEMNIYPELKEKYGLTVEDEIAASCVTLSDALSVIVDSSLSVRNSLLSDLARVTVSDGFCARTEALLMLSLSRCLEDATSDTSSVLSVEAVKSSMEDNQVLYVESRFDAKLNKEIKDNYRQINRDFKLSGFDFVYIPYVAAHYKMTPPDMLSRIVSFLSPNLDSSKLKEILMYVSDITTCEFCNEQIGSKIKELRNCNPSLLFKIGKSYVGGVQFDNFLRVEVDDSLLTMLPPLIDKFTSMLSSDVVVVSNVEEGKNQFLYSGFYKQIFDIYLSRRGVRSSVVIDTQRKELRMPEIDVRLEGLHRKEKSLYVLFLAESKNGGVCLTKPKYSKQMKSFEEKMKTLQRKFNYIYGMFGGESGIPPDLSMSEIRNPMISCIKRSIELHKSSLYHSKDYLVEKNAYGLYTVNLEPELIFVVENGVQIPFSDSLLAKMLSKI